MDQHILPRVEKLKLDRANYLEYQQVSRELEVLHKCLVAYDIFTSQVS